MECLISVGVSVLAFLYKVVAGYRRRRASQKEYLASRGVDALKQGSEEDLIGIREGSPYISQRYEKA